MEKVKLENVKKSDFEKLNVTFDTVFGIFGRPRIGRSDKAYALSSECSDRGRSLVKTKQIKTGSFR